VAVCLYELASRAFAKEGVASAQTLEPVKEQAPAAPSGSLDRLAGVIEQAMTAAGYSPRLMQSANRHDLRVLLRKLAPTERDTRRILGLFRRILWRLRQNGKVK
jgi:tRNA C32,U32 (ribose-2'-O)-methylase TrmJ